jgi:hypothetical protein
MATFYGLCGRSNEIRLLVFVTSSSLNEGAMGLRELFPDGGKTWLPGVNYIGWRAYLIVAMADLVIGCHEGDVALSKQLIGDLPV